MCYEAMCSLLPQMHGEGRDSVLAWFPGHSQLNSVPKRTDQSF